MTHQLALPLEPAVFAGLDNHDAGGLLRLLIHYWETGRALDNDPRLLRKIARVSDFKWAKFFGNICRAALRVEGPLVLCRGLEKALEQQRHIARVRAEAGAAGGRSGRGRSEAIAPVYRVPGENLTPLETQSRGRERILPSRTPRSGATSAPPHPKVDPANWKARHEQRILAEIARRWPTDLARQAVAAVIEGTPRGREIFEAINRQVRAREGPRGRPAQAAAVRALDKGNNLPGGRGTVERRSTHDGL